MYYSREKAFRNLQMDNVGRGEESLEWNVFSGVTEKVNLQLYNICGVKTSVNGVKKAKKQQ